MSVSAAIVTSALSSAAVVVPPAAVMTLASTSDKLPDNARLIAWIGSGLVLGVTFLANLSKALPALQMGMRLLLPKPDAVAQTQTTNHGVCISRRELDERIDGVVTKWDNNLGRVQEDLKELTNSMAECVADLNRAIGRLEGHGKKS